MRQSGTMARMLALAAGIGCSWVVCGCASRDDAAAGSSGASLSAADFRASEGESGSTPTGIGASRTASKGRSPVIIEEGPAAKAPPDLAVVVGNPTAAPGPSGAATDPGTANAAPVASPVVMDALIGDINGTPIYASSFFQPIDARLNGLAAKYKNNRAKWIEESKEIIGGQLRTMVRDQLLLAEARASLTPDQKKGLLAFIDSVRRDLVSKGGGGQAAVDENLREQGEKGLDAKLKENIDQQLIMAKLREKVLPRATVSWHEVQVEYEKRSEKFNPDTKATLRMIWLAADKPEVVETFKSELAKGVAFDELAGRPENQYIPDKGGLVEVSIKGDYSKAEIFGPPELNEPARTLKEGGTSAPITYGKWVAWVHLDSVVTPKAKTIYEAQLSIYNELRSRKLDAESQAYIARLLDRESFTKISEMGDKLLGIATERYFNTGK